jgi:cobaltochelatase CobT
VTIVDVEQLGGALVDQLAGLFDEVPKAVKRARGLLAAPPTVQPPISKGPPKPARKVPA